MGSFQITGKQQVTKAIQLANLLAADTDTTDIKICLHNPVIDGDTAFDSVYFLKDSKDAEYYAVIDGETFNLLAVDETEADIENATYIVLSGV